MSMILQWTACLVAASASLALAGKPTPTCTDDPVTISLASDPEDGTPGLFGDGAVYRNEGGVTATRNSCSGDVFLGLGKSTRTFTLRFGYPLADSGLPSGVINSTLVTQGHFTLRSIQTTSGTKSHAMILYFASPERKTDMLQFSNPCADYPRSGDPATRNLPYLTSKILSVSLDGASWNVAADTAADSCMVEGGTFSSYPGMPPVVTFMVPGTKAQYVSVGQFTFSVNMAITKP